MENYTPDEMIDIILDGSYNKIKKGETLVDELCGKVKKEAEENEIDEVPAPVGKSMDQLEDEITEAEENEIDEVPAPVGKSMDQLEDEITEQPKCPSGFQFCPIRKKCIPDSKGQGRGQQKESVVVRIKETYHGLEEQEKSAYQNFFMSMLKKHNVTSPSQLTGDKKKQFFDAVDKGWKGKKESD